MVWNLQEEDNVAEETAELGAFRFIFTLGVLSFDEAKPPESVINGLS
jgi:hypothetical protein